MCYRRYILALLLCSASVPSPSCGLSTEEDQSAASVEDAFRAIASLEQLQSEVGLSKNELRRLANLYEALQQQRAQRLAEVRERMREEGESLPLALPLKTHGLQDRDEYLQDKRGSYMSLCHFKICNMGRKRSSYWN